MVLYAKPKIVVAGGGFAGLEAAFGLRQRLADQADITLISDRDYFFYKPNSIYIPFGLNPNKLKIPLAPPTKRQKIAFYQSHIDDIDPTRRIIHLDDQEMAYDFLVIATGAGPKSDALPGLAAYGQLIGTAAGMVQLRDQLKQLATAAQAGRRQRVHFLVPAHNRFSGPLYELAFMLDTWLWRQNLRSAVEITFSTYEATFMQGFGSRIHEAILGEFECRGIVGHTNYVAEAVTEGCVFYQDREPLPYDLLIAFPTHAAASIFPALPTDDHGFIETRFRSRQVAGYPNIYAVGDTADFPVKQGVLAMQQADAAAEHLASYLLGTQPGALFEPTGMCVLEAFDTATYVRAPLRMSGAIAPMVEIASDAWPPPKVVKSSLWRLGKKAMGLYLPWRFRSGKPLGCSRIWRGVEMGLEYLTESI